MPLKRHSPGVSSNAPPAAPSKGFSRLSNNPFLAVGANLLLGYVFLSFSRILDILLPGIRLPLVFFVSMFVATLLAGCLLWFMKTNIGRWLFALTLWVAVTLPFSTWRSGSVNFVVDTVHSFIFAAVIIGLIKEMAQIFRLIRIIAYSILAGALLSFAYGQMSYGRLILSQGTFADPNEYAMMLLFSFPFWLWIAKGLSFPLKLAPYICMVPVFIAFIKTGSRGAGIGFLAFCAVLFWQTPLIRKVPLLIVIAITLIGSFALLPNYLKQRYFTFFSADTAQASSDREQEMMEGADVGSSQARLTLLLSSIEITAKHPLFGVGPGQFAYEAWQERKRLGLPTIYNVTHNTYTQISSELGVPGFIIFLGLLISCIRALRSVTRLRYSKLYCLPPRVLDTADSLVLALVVLCVCAFFLSLAYGPLFFVMAAIIAVFHRAVQNALPTWLVAKVPAQPTPAALQRPSVKARVLPAFGTAYFPQVVGNWVVATLKSSM